MEETHKNVIQANWVYLKAHLILECGLLDLLLQEKIFTTDMMEEIESMATTHKKIQDFLFKLVRRGPLAYEAFLFALNNSNQGFIADRLQETLKNTTS